MTEAVNTYSLVVIRDLCFSHFIDRYWIDACETGGAVTDLIATLIAGRHAIEQFLDRKIL